MKKLLLGLLFLLVIQAGTAEIEARIASSCSGDEIALLSMYQPGKTYNNPAAPGKWGQNVCVSGISQGGVSTGSCELNTGFYLSGNTSTSHFSTFSAYNLKVCTGEMYTSVRDSCLPNQTALFSVSGKDNAHVAQPGVFTQEVCGYFRPPKNVTLKLRFNLTGSDDVYIDGTEVGEQTVRIAEFPYIASEGGGNVAGIAADSFLRADRQINGENVLLMEQKGSNGEFFIPLTQGGHRTIEGRQEEILNDEFLGMLEPSFGFFIPDTPTVRTILDRNISIDTTLDLGPGPHRLKIVKTGDNEIRLKTVG